MKVFELMHLLAAMDPNAEVVAVVDEGAPRTVPPEWKLSSRRLLRLPLPEHRRPIVVVHWTPGEGLAISITDDPRTLYLAAMGASDA